MRIAVVIVVTGMATALLPALASAETTFAPEHIDFFETKVRPVLVSRCVSCHGEEKQEAGLRLDGRAAILHGSDSGKVAVPGKPEESGLIRAIRYEDYEMPPSGQMPEEEIAAIEQWVKLGMPWPEEEGAIVPQTFDQRLADHRANHWAYQPIQDPAPPAVESDWVKNDIDRFVLHKMQEKGIAPSELADRRTLIRRATFDLHGLPPTLEEVEAFVNDESPDAYEKLIDRLLASPRYGEKWGRHWLDVARYSDTRGYLNNGQDRRFPYAFAYRDYVIDSFNRDTPYDEFIKEQLAADYFAEEGDRRLAGLGLIRIGRQYLAREETIDDRIDVVTRGILGLTVSCARCHDHKYDAISAADYYGFYGIFENLEETAPLIGELDAHPEYPTFKEGYDKLQKELSDYQANVEKNIRDDSTTYFFDLIIRAVSKKQDTEIAAYEQNEQDPKQVRRHLINRWKRFVDNVVKPDHAVWGPLAETRDLGEEAYAEQHEALLAKWTAEDSQVNAHVRAQLAERKPATLMELVDTYNQILKPLGKRWREHGEAKAALEGLEGAEREVAQSLYGAHSPVNLNDGDIRAGHHVNERNETRKLEGKIRAHELDTPGAPPRAMAVADREKINEPVIFIRGNRGRRGDRVPRQFLSVLIDEQDSPYTNGTGRLELAEDLVAEDNPLTSRVIANRVWMRHFDRALVRTPGDFGVRSDPPVQGELLDHLAKYLTKNGWSLKQLHRYIMHSATYRQSSADRPELRKSDVENELLWKMNRRRLTFEEMRDSMLAVSGRLDETMGGRAVKILEPPYPPRRTVYGFIDRQDLPNLYRAFDFASPDATTAERPKTSVPQQTLYLLNSPFVQQQAQALTASWGEAELSDHEKLEHLFGKVLQRSPKEHETQLFLDYLAQSSESSQEDWTAWDEIAQVLLVSNEFMFVD